MSDLQFFLECRFRICSDRDLVFSGQQMDSCGRELIPKVYYVSLSGDRQHATARSKHQVPPGRAQSLYAVELVSLWK